MPNCGLQSSGVTSLMTPARSGEYLFALSSLSLTRMPSMPAGLRPHHVRDHVVADHPSRRRIACHVEREPEYLGVGFS